MYHHASRKETYNLILIKSGRPEMGQKHRMETRILRHFLSLILSASLLLAAAAQGVLAASAPVGPLTEMVICSHSGDSTVVLVDANGDPVDPAEPCAMGHCFLCSSGGIAGPLPEGPKLLELSTSRPADWVEASIVEVVRPLHPMTARAPPFET